MTFIEQKYSAGLKNGVNKFSVQLNKILQMINGLSWNQFSHTLFNRQYIYISLLLQIGKGPSTAADL